MRTVVHIFFFFNDTATTEIYTLSLHDALPISSIRTQRSDMNKTWSEWANPRVLFCEVSSRCLCRDRDRKSTRLNSSHDQISYAVFCLKKKNFRHFSNRNFML